jgi:molybdate transport system substrate-binding protein
MIRRVALTISFTITFAFPALARAADVTLLCSNGMKAAVEKLLPQFEKTTGHHVVATYDLAANIKRRIETGAPFDAVIVTPPAVMDDLIKEGHAAATTRTPLARSGLSILIRKGAPRVDISTVDKFTRALLDASSIAYVPEGASGKAFLATAERLGIADRIAAKSVRAEGADAVAAAVTSGKAQIAIMPLSESQPVAGGEVMGMFPAEAQSYVTLVAAVGTHARERAAAEQLVKFLASSGADAVVKQSGMERVPK